MGMGLRWARLRNWLASVLLLPLCAGCVAFGGVDRTTGAIDKSVGTARNNSILLNIVRASRNEPLYFYSISRVSGNALEDFKFSLPAVTFGPHQAAAQHNFTLGYNGLNILDSQQSGSFDVALLESHNFYEGMLAPLDPSEVDLLLRQGFPRELVYRLAVQDVTVYDGKTLTRLVNDPASPTYDLFQIYFKAAMDDGIATETLLLSPPQDNGSAADSSGKAKPAGPRTVTRLCWDPALAKLDVPEVKADLDGSNNECGVRPPGAATTFSTSPPGLKQTYDDCTAAPGSPANAGASSSAANRVCVKFKLHNIAIQLDTRSLFGILQYLGRLLAAEEHGDGAHVALQDLGSPVEPRVSGPLMSIVKGKGGDCFASINWQTSYCLPREGGENLKTTFTIINALQALKTAPGDLPVTTPVRIEQ